MAEKKRVDFIDDIDGSDAEFPATSFGLDGVFYEIDLSTAHHEGLHEALQPYIDAARRVGGRRRPVVKSVTKIGAKSPATIDKAQTDHIRQWGNENGFTVSTVGRLPNALIEAYNAAQDAAQVAAQEAKPARRRKPRAKAVA